MRRTSLAVVLAVASGSVVLSAAQPGEHAALNTGLHAAALGAWRVADLDPPRGQAAATAPGVAGAHGPQ